MAKFKAFSKLMSTLLLKMNR